MKQLQPEIVHVSDLLGYARNDRAGGHESEKLIEGIARYFANYLERAEMEPTIAADLEKLQA